MSLAQRLKQHIRNNRWQYIVIGLVFLVGLVMGGQKVEGLEGGVRDYLRELIDTYLQEGQKAPIYGPGILLAALATQAKTVVAIWFLGLTVIGVPLILAVVFLRGYALGFTVGFLVQQKGGAGVIMSILSILPQNLVYIPLLIIWAVIAVNFSSYLIGRHPGAALGKTLINYSLLLAVFLVLFTAGAFIEAYLSPWFLSLIL
ncbi:MAG TPA: stage II sporulation protein M [Syntrophomonadaceae bacterium]|jgi:stage II sporulation protein M|nr:stage II sporulation protein M [Syntrophomonadaceae bacterium]HOQ09104.1 stage II sporulation protein M [Syntrophomonadaceae bacterium]HPU48647.1 stage II sporulation protein M [Syntrophomonadaceae bacterium]